jgi:glycosyltransferase involved in cell wall biosynthesis
MDVTYIDPEPPGPGGGIRTYLRLALKACRDRGVAARVYTHNASAYPGEAALAIGRESWLGFPWRPLAYRLGYVENVFFEHAKWLSGELEREDRPDRVYEFADFAGYAYFALRSPVLRGRVTLRIHTPNFLVEGAARSPARILGRYREKSCLSQARHITAPSAAFVREKLPWVRGWEHLPNPLPDFVPAPREKLPGAQRILYLGRVETRKGVLVLLRAFLRIAESQPRATLTLVGAATPGPYARQVKSLIGSLPPEMRSRIAWEPPCPPEARAALLARFDVLAVPSLWENSPYVYFEGMAAELLCVGTATGEMREAAYVTGGLLAAPGDEEDLAEALRKACTWPDRGGLIGAQNEYLRERAQEIPGRLVAHYRRILGLEGST